jgi:hypothetical protein
MSVPASSVSFTTAGRSYWRKLFSMWLCEVVVQPVWFRPAGATALTIAVTLLVGCDSAVDKIFDAMSGRQTNLVILSKQPVTLAPAPVTITSTEPMKVLGEWTSVCLVLRDGITLKPQPQMDKILSEALGGAKVSTTLELSDGSRVALHEPMLAWEHIGRILSRDELSACASASCAAILPRGATVKRVEISANPAVQVRGIYWQSHPGPDEPQGPSDSSRPPLAPDAHVNCTGKP